MQPPMVGRVVAVGPTGLDVAIPSRYPGAVWRGLPVVEGMHRIPRRWTEPDGPGPHTHPIPAVDLIADVYAVGDRVLVVATDLDELVVVGPIRASARE